MGLETIPATGKHQEVEMDFMARVQPRLCIIWTGLTSATSDIQLRLGRIRQHTSLRQGVRNYLPFKKSGKVWVGRIIIQQQFH